MENDMMNRMLDSIYRYELDFIKIPLLIHRAKQEVIDLILRLSIFNGAVTLLNLAGDAAQSRRNRRSIRLVLVHWRGGIFTPRAFSGF